nr:MAG TPA: hypothetical protein [Caudoviricetes sp.]
MYLLSFLRMFVYLNSLLSLCILNRTFLELAKYSCICFHITTRLDF